MADLGSPSLSIADSGRVVRAVLRAAYRRRRALLDLEGCCALANYFVRVASCHVSTAWRVLLGLQQLLQKGGGGLEEAHASIMISWRHMLRPWEFLPTDFILSDLLTRLPQNPESWNRASVKAFSPLPALGTS